MAKILAVVVLMFFVPIMALLVCLFSSCGGQTGQEIEPTILGGSTVAHAEPTTPVAPVSPVSSVGPSIPRTVFFDANETAKPIPGGVNPVLSKLNIPPNTLQDGSVILVFGAFYQAGEVDQTLTATVWWLDGDHLSGDIPIGQTAQFLTQILVFKTSGGGYLWRITNFSSQSPMWPKTPQASDYLDGGVYVPPGISSTGDSEMDDLGDLTQPIPVWIQINGNLQGASQLTLHDFVVKVLNP